MTEPRVLSEEQIQEVVARVLAGGAGTLETAVNEALWPDGVPETWGGWSAQAIRVWDRCVRVYVARAMVEADVGVRSRNTTTVEESWLAVLKVCPDPARWWEIGASWATDLAEALGLSRRVAAYRMGALGWRFTESTRKGVRLVLRAPCRRCGQPHSPSALDGAGIGPGCCRSK